MACIAAAASLVGVSAPQAQAPTSLRAKMDYVVKACAEHAGTDLQSQQFRVAIQCEGTVPDPEAAAADYPLTGTCKSLEQWCRDPRATAFQASAREVARGFQCSRDLTPTCNPTGAVQPQNCLRPSAPLGPDCRDKIAALLRAGRELGEVERWVVQEEHASESQTATTGNAGKAVSVANTLVSVRKAYKNWREFNKAFGGLSLGATLEPFGITSIPFCEATVACYAVGTALDPTLTQTGAMDAAGVHEHAQQVYMDALKAADPEDFARLDAALSSLRNAPPSPFNPPDCSSQRCFQAAPPG